MSLSTGDQKRKLGWKLGNWEHLYVIPVPTDGHCLFHAISLGLLKSYRTSIPSARHKYVKKLRKELAERFTRKEYESLFDSRLAQEAISVPEFSYENMLETLNTDRHIGGGFFSFICDKLSFDIYFLDDRNKCVYKSDEFSFTQKDRRSIIILFSNNNHYDLIVLKNPDGTYSTFLQPDHKLILYLRKHNGSQKKE
jgi:hypothetical protein